MAEIVPYRRKRQWTRAGDYGAPKGRGGRGGKRRGPERKDRRGGWGRAARELGPTLWALPLALGVAAYFAAAPKGTLGSLSAAIPVQTGADREQASFGTCGAFASREACVVDGDTFWYRGTKIRVADINTPETSDPKCAAEAELGARATARFKELLNAGAFSLEPADRTHDKYGRALFVVTRDGESVGNTLVDEWLAEEWQGYRSEWC